MRTIPIALLCVAAVAASGANFSSSARGRSTAEFLELGVDARGIAMGQAYSAVVDDAGALYWNPAALTRIQKRAVNFMHAAYIDSSYFDYGAYGQKIGIHAAMGASIQYFSAGAIARTDANGADIGSFTPYDMAITVGGAYSFAEKGWSIGCGGKFIQSRILHTAQTKTMDFGLLSPGYFDNRLRLAFTGGNLIGKLKFDQESENLPRFLRFAAAYQVTQRWLIALDNQFPMYDRFFTSVGTEFRIGEFAHYRLANSNPWGLALRAGFNSKTIGSIDGFTGASMGVGLNHKNTFAHYAFVPLGSVGQAHHISISSMF